MLLTHTHLDHTLGLPFRLAHSRLRVFGLEEVLDAVRESLLDGRIYPDRCATGRTLLGSV